MRVSPAGGASLKLASAIFGATLLALLISACDLVGGGGNDSLNPNAQSVTRPGSVPTATPPATLPEPILLGAATDPIGGTNPAGTPTTGGPTAGGAATYTVKPGDTLAAIASSQGVTGSDQASWIAEVLRLNNIADARLLAAGQELQLPRQVPATNATPRAGTTTTPNTTPTRASGTPTAAQTPRPGTTPTTASTPSTGGGTTYVVQSGDTPGGIASKLNVPAAQQTAWVTQLLQLNNVTAQTLQIGQTLNLPPIPR
jgi:LysM repeat protein